MIFIVGGFLWAYISLVGMSSGQFIIHFNDIDDITQLGGLNNLVFMGFFGLIIAIMNFAIAVEFDERDPFLGKITGVATLAFGILLFMAFAAILNVN